MNLLTYLPSLWRRARVIPHSKGRKTRDSTARPMFDVISIMDNRKNRGSGLLPQGDEATEGALEA